MTIYRLRSIFDKTNYSVPKGVILTFFGVIILFYCGLIALDILHVYIDNNKLLNYANSDSTMSITNIFECDTASIQMSNLVFVKIGYTTGEVIISWVLLRLLVKRLVILHIAKETTDFMKSKLRREKRNSKHGHKPSTFKKNKTKLHPTIAKSHTMNVGSSSITITNTNTNTNTNVTQTHTPGNYNETISTKGNDSNYNAEDLNTNSNSLPPPRRQYIPQSNREKMLGESLSSITPKLEPISVTSNSVKQVRFSDLSKGFIRDNPNDTEYSVEVCDLL